MKLFKGTEEPDEYIIHLSGKELRLIHRGLEIASQAKPTLTGITNLYEVIDLQYIPLILKKS